jgi:hypothetical protein
VPNADMRTGIIAGGFVKIGLMPGFAIQPELLYAMKGDKESASVGGLSATATAKFDYIEVPVLLKYSFGAVIVPSIYVGPTLSLLSSAKFEQTMNGTTTTGDIKSYMKSTDLGLAVGAEVKTPFKLSVEARYTMSLATIDKATSVGTADVKNSVISLMVGYYIF